MLKDKFIQYIRFEKRYSPHTQLAYNTDLDQFYYYINTVYELNDVTEVTSPIVRSWIVFLMEKSIDTRSINRKISVLKSFFKFLLKEGDVDANPMTQIISPKNSKRIPAFVEQEKMDLLLDDVSFGIDFKGQRDKLILEMFYFTGIRLSELINLREWNIDLVSNNLKVLGKRNKERLIPFGNELREAIIKYKVVRSEISGGLSNENYFFVTVKGKKVYEKLVYRLVNLYLSKVSSITKKSPHILRHTFATHMLNNGAELNAVKELLGHASLSATQVYTHNTIEKLKSVYNQAHPRA
ncbi:MAG: tyrosine-type recombinase/integrase [Bacteroidales bacterium]|nr:tyrosine-type recombinase/integrase [Bacteroidales bacterium]